MSDLISRQAAIEAILAIKDYDNSDRANALGLAECAITTLPSAQPKKRTEERAETHACDCIDRQAAISAICNACGKIDCDKMDKCKKLQLPPANCSEFPNNSDTISRQAAIDALRYAQHRFTVADEAGGIGTVKWSEDVIYFAAAERILTELPSAQPERKTGRWLQISPAKIYECSECAQMVMTDDISCCKYCHGCGAYMGGGEGV